MSSVETIAGATLLLIIVLALLDMGVVVLANSVMDGVAKNAARAAANQQTETGANTAAQKAVAAVPASPIIASLTLLNVSYNEDNNGLVKAKVRMQVRLPVPVPGYDVISFDAQSVEPLVARR